MRWPILMAVFASGSFKLALICCECARHVAGEFGVRRDPCFERRVFARDVDIGIEGVGVPERGSVGLVGDFEPEEVAIDLGDQVVALEALAVVQLVIRERGRCDAGGVETCDFFL